MPYLRPTVRCSALAPLLLSLTPAARAQFLESEVTVLYAVDGEAPGDSFGLELVAVGDYDGDGVPELLVGSWESKVGAFNGGQAHVFSGSDGERLRSITSTVPGAFLGGSAAGLGLVNGDDAPDFALGANGNGGTRGRVYVIAGRVRLGDHYCSVNANSSGAPAVISAIGSASIADQDFTPMLQHLFTSGGPESHLRYASSSTTE